MPAFGATSPCRAFSSPFADLGQIGEVGVVETATPDQSIGDAGDEWPVIPGDHECTAQSRLDWLAAAGEVPLGVGVIDTAVGSAQHLKERHSQKK